MRLLRADFWLFSFSFFVIAAGKLPIFESESAGGPAYAERGIFLLTTLGVYLINHFTITLALKYEATVVGRWLALFVPTHPDIEPGSVPLHWITIIGFTLLNAFYEELVYVGYVFNQWAQKYGAAKAVLFTAFLRLIVHTYQGTEHLLPIALWSVLFSVWYRYQRKLWPLILAHFLIDLLSLSLFKVIFGAP